jgi:hypothetical protein
LEHVLPGSFAQEVRDADIFFDIELPDMLLWPFGAVEAGRITRPELSLAGAESNSMYSAVEQLVREWPPARGRASWEAIICCSYSDRSEPPT